MRYPTARGTDPSDATSRYSRRQVMGGAAGAALAASALPLSSRQSATAQDSVNVIYKTHEHPPAVAFNNVLIEEFQAANPGITIEYEAVPYPNLEQGLFTSFAGGEGWDLFWSGDWLIPQFFENDILSPFNAEAFGMTADELIAANDPGALDAFIKDGTLYTGGISEYNTFSLVYNPDHFDEAGIPIPSETEPLTWEQIAEYSTQLAQVDSGGTRTRNALVWAFDANVWTPLILEPMIRQLGGEILDPESGELLLTSPEVVKAFAYFGDMAEQGSIDPAFFGTTLIDDFAQDRTSMTIAGPWVIPAVRGLKPDAKIGIAPLPMFDGGERVTTLYSWGWFVGNQSPAETQAAAWKFLGYITSQGKRWWDEAGFIMPRNGGQEGIEDLAAYRNESEPLLKVFNDDYTYGRYMFRSPRFYEIANALFRVQSLVFEGEDAEQALQDAQDELSI